MTPFLEKMIFEGQARSLSFCSIGSALSSFNVPQGYSAIIWSIQVFPFFDLDNALVSASESSNYLRAARCVHAFEFRSDKDAYLYLHRSNVAFFADGLAAVPPNAPGRVPMPSNGGEVVPVYWFLRGTNITLRITTLPAPSVSAPNVGVPPASEGQVLMGYPPATPVVINLPGFGDDFTGNPPLRYVPDQRRALASIKQNYQPRPMPDPVNDDTALQIQTNLASNVAAFTYPVVNVQYVILKNSAIGKLGSI